MKVTETLELHRRVQWRGWLAENHTTAKEIWLVFHKEKTKFTYLDSVEEALCFGWIDGIAKKLDKARLAQRFTPRRKKSHWTELNKERARRLIARGLMTEAGYAVLPDLTINFRLASDIKEALMADKETWQNFQKFPDLYQRIRIGFIEEMRGNPDLFQTRLNNFLKKTKQNKMFGKME
jgi:hypothetical protein